MSLISDTIKTMGDPNAHDALDSSSATSQSSIRFLESAKDWWDMPSYLQRPTKSTDTSPKVAAARARNAKIEYDLFRAILSPDVVIVPPGEEVPDAPILGRFLDVELPELDGMYIHEFELVNKTDLSLPKKEIVVIHGYMAAMGYFVKNFEPFVKSYGNVRIHVIDMPGFGNSARPLFPKKLIKATKTKAEEINQVIEVENWFIDKLEAWRTLRDISHFSIIAHSMGAYIASCYIMKFSDKKNPIVSDFVVVSPMGTESSYVSLLKDKKLHYNHHESGGDPLQEIIASQDFNEDQEVELLKLWEKIGRPKFPKNAVLRTLWDWNVSPFQVLQYFGPMYLKLLSYWSFQRFKNLRSNESTDASENTNLDLILKLHAYSYSIFNQYQGSGELAITKLINHEILARLPLCDRGFVEHLHDSGTRTLWLYGDKDWMNKNGGEYCVQKLVALGDTNTEFQVVKNAGHHIYLDNPDEFNRIVLGFLGLEKATRTIA